MPIIKVGNGYIYKINSKNTKKAKWKFFLLLLVCLLSATILFMFVFSKFNLTSLFGMNKFEVYSGTSFYAVSLESGDTFTEASQNANAIKLQDGAGYVYQSGHKYYLLASVYKNKADAERVCENLTDYEARVVEIKYDRLVLNSEFSSEQIRSLKYGLETVDRFFETMQNITLSFDRGEILDAEARHKLQVFKETCQADKEIFSKAFKDSGENIVTYVKIFQNEVISNLSTISVSQNLSSDLKYITLSTIVSFERLQNNVRK